MKGIIVLDVPKNCKECCLMTSSGHCSPTHRDIFRYGVKEKKAELVSDKRSSSNIGRNKITAQHGRLPEKRIFAWLELLH